MNRLMVMVCIGFLCSCKGVFKKDVREFMEGSYVRDFDNEFAVGVDSVVLQKQGENNYLILKYSRYSRIVNGESGKEEMHEQKMMGVYDADKQVINELKKGKVIHFNPEKNVMMIGASEYVKVK